jgi:hypothetical protein
MGRNRPKPGDLIPQYSQGGEEDERKGEEGAGRGQSRCGTEGGSGGSGEGRRPEHLGAGSRSDPGRGDSEDRRSVTKLSQEGRMGGDSERDRPLSV